MAFDIRKLLQGAVAQVNPFDGGQDFASVQRRPASTARPRPNFVQQAGNNLASTARSVANARIPSLGVSLNEIGAQLPKAVDTTLTNAPFLNEAYKFGKMASTPQFQQQSLPQQVGQFAQGIGKTGYDWTLGGLERTGGRIAATATGKPQQSFSGSNLPVAQELNQAAPIAGNKLLGQTVAGLGIAGDALSLPSVTAGTKALTQGAKDVAKAAKGANKSLGEQGFISVSAPIIDKPLNPKLAPEAKVAVSEAQNTIEQLHQQIAVAQDSINYAKEHVATLKIPQAQKDAALAKFVQEANMTVAQAKQEMGGWLDHINQLDPSGASRPVRSDAPTGIPKDQVTLLQQQAAADAPKPSVASKIASSFKQAVGNERGSVDLDAPIVGSKLPTKTKPSLKAIKAIAESKPAKDPSILKHEKGDFVREPQTLNPNRLDLDNTQRTQILEQTTKEVKEKLTHKQIMEVAKSAGINTKARNIDETAQRIAEDLNARRQVVESANRYTKLQTEGGSKSEIAKAFSETFKQANVAAAQGTDAGRALAARRIIANELDTPMQRVIKLLRTADVDPEKAAKLAVDVDWNDAKSVTEFYRKLAPASAGDWLDLLRYNSMLSSPLTHIVNNASNALNTGLVAPIEKTLTGAIDFFRTGGGLAGERKAFAGEGAAYVKGYAKSTSEALDSMVKALKGDVEMENLDVHDIPLATSGLKGAAYKALIPPTRALAASDKFFRTLAEGGERAALELRQGKGVKVANMEDAVKDAGKYRVFQQDTKPGTQGGVLDTIDGFTNILMSARGGQYGKGVAQIAKWTVPFVKTPMNIFKQGLEYSPAGFSTIPGAANKQEQLAKAMLGSTVFMGAATVLASGRLTWAEPTDKKGKETFKEAGMQPYSIKLGDKWVQFSKMPPTIAFPFAMVAAVDDALSKKTINQGTATAIAEAISKYGSFLADQSYAKSIGDILASVKGDAEAKARAVANYPQQLFPWRAASSWIARLGDDTERRVDPDKDFIAKQVETFMQSIPGLRTQTTARLDSVGEPLKTNNGTFNNFSPFKVTNEYPAGAAAYKDLMQGRMDKKNETATKEETKTKTTGSKVLDASKKRVAKVKEKLPSGISKTSSETLTQYAALSAEGKDKFNAVEANQLKLHQAQYEQNKLSGKLTDAKDFEAQNKLAKEAVTSKYSQEVQDFYGLSKAQQNAYFASNRPKAKELYDQAKKLDSELLTGKFTATPKYKYGLGKKPKVAKYAKKGKLNYSKQLASSKSNSTALRSILSRVKIKRKSIKVAKAKVSKA